MQLSDEGVLKTGVCGLGKVLIDVVLLRAGLDYCLAMALWKRDVILHFRRSDRCISCKDE